MDAVSQYVIDSDDDKFRLSELKTVNLQKLVDMGHKSLSSHCTRFAGLLECSDIGVLPLQKGKGRNIFVVKKIKWMKFWSNKIGLVS